MDSHHEYLQLRAAGLSHEEATEIQARRAGFRLMTEDEERAEAARQASAAAAAQAAATRRAEEIAAAAAAAIAETGERSAATVAALVRRIEGLMSEEIQVALGVEARFVAAAAVKGLILKNRKGAYIAPKGKK